MTAAGQARCGRCISPIGVEQPIFTTRHDTGYPWLSFSGCRICGALRCASCAAEAAGRCDACGDPLIADVFPPVWLNSLSIWGRGWCIASPSGGGPDRLHVRSSAPDAPWWSCLICGSELCDPCARDRGERCRCLARVVLGGRPPAAAYLPPDLRQQIRDPGRSRTGKEALLRAAISKIDADWERGVINGLEYATKQVYEAALRELITGT